MQLLRENGALFSLLREQGCTLSGAGDAALYGLPSAVGAADTGSETVSGESMADLLIKRTPLYIFHASDYLEDAQEVLRSIDYMKDPNNHNRDEPFYALLGDYWIEFYCRENAQNYGLVNTNLILRKSGKGISIAPLVEHSTIEQEAADLSIPAQAPHDLNFSISQNEKEDSGSVIIASVAYVNG